MISRFLGILLVTMIASQAQAGWRFAEWGMSKEELVAAADEPLRPHREPNAESWGEYPAFKSTANEMRHTFEVWYYVDRYDGLYAIRLVPQGSYWCIDIRENAMRRWGYAELRYEDQNPTWRKPAANNRISIINVDGCTVKLEPLDMAGVRSD